MFLLVFSAKEVIVYFHFKHLISWNTYFRFFEQASDENIDHMAPVQYNFPYMVSL